MQDEPDIGFGLIGVAPEEIRMHRIFSCSGGSNDTSFRCPSDRLQDRKLPQHS